MKDRSLSKESQNQDDNPNHDDNKFHRDLKKSTQVNLFDIVVHYGFQCSAVRGHHGNEQVVVEQ